VSNQYRGRRRTDVQGRLIGARVGAAPELDKAGIEKTGRTDSGVGEVAAVTDKDRTGVGQRAIGRDRAAAALGGDKVDLKRTVIGEIALQVQRDVVVDLQSAGIARQP